MSLREMVWETLRRSEWRTLWQIRSAINMQYKRLASDASISARIRELRARGKRIDRRAKAGATSHEYRIGRAT